MRSIGCVCLLFAAIALGCGSKAMPAPVPVVSNDIQDTALVGSDATQDSTQASEITDVMNCTDCSPCGPVFCPDACEYEDVTNCPDGTEPDETEKDAGFGFENSQGGCAPWFGQGCGGCACEKAVCASTPECCDTLWGQACALECADKGGKCSVPDAETTDMATKDTTGADTGAFACVAKHEGSIPGALIDLAKTPCVFSISKAAGKFALPYQIVIDKATQVFMTDPNAGQCPPSNDFGGLSTFVTLDGIGDGTPQQWCLCDVGLCAAPGGDFKYVATKPGKYSHEFVWDGKNFQGPSDTGMKPGAPFPPGEYTLKIKSTGHYLQADGQDDVFSSTSSMQIQLNP